MFLFVHVLFLVMQALVVFLWIA